MPNRPEAIRQNADKMPEKLRQVFFAEETANAIYAIAEKQGVIAKVSLLAEITGAILMGALPIQEFRQIIQDELEIDEQTSREIAIEIRNKIFVKAANELRKVHGLDK